MINAHNLPAHEWIGLECRVVHSTDPKRIGVSGKIVDETKNTIRIETKQGEKVVPKNEVELEVRIDNHALRLQTAEWCFSPEDRIKAFFRKKKTVGEKKW